MARLANLTEILTAHALTMSDDPAFMTFDDGIRREPVDVHMRRMRSDNTRSEAARHRDLSRYSARRVKSTSTTL